MKRIALFAILTLVVMATRGLAGQAGLITVKSVNRLPDDFGKGNLSFIRNLINFIDHTRWHED